MSMPNVDECPDFKLPASFSFDPENTLEAIEIQHRAREHRRVCPRCSGIPIGALKFETGDRVRVVTSDSPFFGWTGTVYQRFRGDLEFQKNHYTVTLDAFAELPDTQPCLFREMQLAHSL